VASDPARASGLDVPGGWPGLTYFRCHGSPRMYFSTYSPEWLTRLAETVGKTPSGTDAWCIFDNTGSGAAAGNAVELDAILRDPRENQTR